MYSDGPIPHSIEIKPLPCPNGAHNNAVSIVIRTNDAEEAWVTVLTNPLAAKRTAQTPDGSINDKINETGALVGEILTSSSSRNSSSTDLHGMGTSADVDVKSKHLSDIPITDATAAEPLSPDRNSVQLSGTVDFDDLQSSLEEVDDKTITTPNDVTVEGSVAVETSIPFPAPPVAESEDMSEPVKETDDVSSAIEESSNSSIMSVSAPLSATKSRSRSSISNDRRSSPSPTPPELQGPISNRRSSKIQQCKCF